MQVYLIFDDYFEDTSNNTGSMLLGVYSSMEKALQARDRLVVNEIAERTKMGFVVEQSVDFKNDPMLDFSLDGNPYMCSIYSIRECIVN
jgi:hypothetical protein